MLFPMDEEISDFPSAVNVKGPPTFSSSRQGTHCCMSHTTVVRLRMVMAAWRPSGLYAHHAFIEPLPGSAKYRFSPALVTRATVPSPHATSGPLAPAPHV